MGFGNIKHNLSYTNTEYAYLIDLLGFEDVLKNLEVGDVLIFVLSVHLNP